MSGRLAIKAAIRRALRSARRGLETLDAETRRDLERLYQEAATDIQRQLEAYADDRGNLRAAALDEMLEQTVARLDRLSEERTGVLGTSLERAASLGTTPWAEDPGVQVGLAELAETAVRQVRNFVADDGLQLSDRIWRIDRGAEEAITDALESAVLQGESASRAAREFLARGEDIPRDILDKIDAAALDRVQRALGEALLRDEGAAYNNALRVFRTEINRAHGEAYRAGMEQSPEVVGERFVLSPAHPRPDICDLHAEANLHGMGPGVYPVGKSPWPAHPNTLSYLEPVFSDEIPSDAAATQEDRLSWLKRQPPGVQRDVLGQKKAELLRRGELNQNEINTPWRILKQRKNLD